MTYTASWTLNLPTSWMAKPLRAVADYTVSNVDKISADNETSVRLCNYTEVYNHEFITLDLDFMQATASESEIEKFTLHVGDVIITKDSESWDDIGVPALVKETSYDLVCGYHLAILRPHKRDLEGRFLLRCLQAKPVRLQLELAANGVTRFGIPKAEIGSMTIPVPPLYQQHAIADYLDRKTAHLAGLIAVKERLLELLAEKRHAVITRAITRGLNTDVPLRDSGLPWPAQIPQEWDLLKLKWLVKSVESGVSVNATDQPKETGYVGVLKTSAVSGGRFHPNENKVVWASEIDRVSCPVKHDSIIMSRMNTPSLVGESGYVDQDYPELYLPDRLWEILFNNRLVYTPFMSHVLSSSGARDSLSSMATGTSASMKNLSKEEMLTLTVPLPTIPEQQDIVVYISNETSKIDALRLATEHTITLLKERRAALIAAVVTGKIKVV